ncbi:hypothetical protein [Pseudomonas fluorescens]|uniref:Uncharacterized protein n=1 Tax=Pseudomonas fluorescens TaxID=294 RepID=A0A5E7AZ77_PSEFL|nr:hypothetical protein [Pseudomonas fluorescens]VVN79423.1 hypothetical protein PS723_00962 [Pseudomonas fluorescens]
MPTTPAGQRLRLYDTDDLNGVMQTMARHAATLLPASQAALIGIQRRGEPLARLLQQHLSRQTGQPEMPTAGAGQRPRGRRACQKAGAIRLLAAATHGLFTGGSDLLDSPLFERITICDSVPPFRLPPEQVTQRLHVLDSTAMVATLLAENGAWVSEDLLQFL